MSCLILSLSLCKDLAPPGYSSPKTKRFKKVKNPLLLAGLPGPLPTLVPERSAQPAQHLATMPCYPPAHRPLLGCPTGPQAGLSPPGQGQQPPLLQCLVQSCDDKNVLSEGNQQGRASVFSLANFSVQPSPKRPYLSASLSAVPSLYGSHCSISRHPLHPDIP